MGGAAEGADAYANAAVALALQPAQRLSIFATRQQCSRSCQSQRSEGTGGMGGALMRIRVPPSTRPLADARGDSTVMLMRKSRLHVSARPVPSFHRTIS